MGAVIGIAIGFAIIMALVLFLLLIEEPPTPQQRANEAKRKIKHEKKHGIAEIDALTEDHRQQVFELLSQASQQMVKEQAMHARRHAQEVVAQAAKEN